MTLKDKLIDNNKVVDKKILFKQALGKLKGITSVVISKSIGLTDVLHTS